MQTGIVRRFHTIGNFENAGGVIPPVAGLPAPINPYSLSGLFLLMDAAAGTGAGNFDFGGNFPHIVGWFDQINAYGLSSSSNNDYSATGFNGSFPGCVCQGGGANNWILNGGFKPLFLNFTSLTMFMLCQLPYQTADNGLMMCMQAGSSVFGTGCMMQDVFNEGDGLRNGLYQFDGGDHMSAEPILAINTPWFVGWTWNGTTNQWYSQGRLYGSGASTTTGTLGAGTDPSNLFRMFDNNGGTSNVTPSGSVITMAGMTSTVIDAATFLGMASWFNANRGTSFT